jgi:signal transduction histidine kinase
MKTNEETRPLSAAARIAAMSRVGAALMSELDENRLLHLIAQTACELTRATFAAFSLRPVNDEGEPLVPSEGNLFHLAAVVGVTAEQEVLFQHMSLGGEGLLAPIFRQGIPVRVADALTFIRQPTPLSRSPSNSARESAREAAIAYAHGHLPADGLQSIGVPRGHPVVRSFLGAPLLDRHGQVRGGLLLGHAQPDQFTHEDEVLLVGLAAQAAVALENARLYRTTQRQAQELRAIFDSITDGVTLVDQQGHLLRENASARRLRQLLESTPQGMQAFHGLLHAPARRVLDNQAVEDDTVSVVDASGETREYLVTASSLRLDTPPSGPLSQQQERESILRDAVVSSVVVVWHDVTERRLREAERQAREHARQLEAIFEAMTDGVFVFDGEGRMVQMNKAAHQFLERLLLSDYADLPLEERFARNVAYDEQGQQLPPEHLPTARILSGEVLTPENAVEMALHDLHGQAMHLSVTGGPLPDSLGHIIGAVSIARDVTERRRLEQIERQVHAETEARLSLLQLILNELPSSVYLVRGHDARLVLANRATATIWRASWPAGQSLSEFLQEHAIRIFDSNGQALGVEELATLRAAQKGEAVFQHQEVIRHADGTSLPVLVNAVPLDGHHLGALPGNGTPCFPGSPEPAAIVVLQDVTALKEAEYLKDEFISIAAHELRTPIAALQGFAQMLLVQNRRGRGVALADWQVESLEEIEQATLRLVELAEDLLDVTRLQAGRLILHREPTDLVALVQRVVSRMHMTTQQHRLTVATAQDHLVAEIDPGRMEQVLTNLLGNAIKYSPVGGSIEIILCESEAQEIFLSVRDHGIGIPAQQQATIFGRFMRANNARACGIGGTGLGLYLSRELVALQDGRIWFESTEGQGSTFFVALPIASA